MKKANKIFHLEQFSSQNDFKNCKNHNDNNYSEGKGKP